MEKIILRKLYEHLLLYTVRERHVHDVTCVLGYVPCLPSGRAGQMG